VRIIRRHWSAENSCHHGLDVTFQKDHYQVRDSNTAHSPPPQRALRKPPPPRSLFPHSFHRYNDTTLLMRVSFLQPSYC
jgi:hypothetical protein